MIHYVTKILRFLFLSNKSILLNSVYSNQVLLFVLIFGYSHSVDKVRQIIGFVIDLRQKYRGFNGFDIPSLDPPPPPPPFFCSR